MGKQFQVSKLGHMAQDIVNRYAQCQAVKVEKLGWKKKRERGKKTSEIKC